MRRKEAARLVCAGFTEHWTFFFCARYCDVRRCNPVVKARGAQMPLAASVTVTMSAAAAAAAAYYTYYIAAAAAAARKQTS